MKEELRRGIKKPINLLFICVSSLLMISLFTYVHLDRYETFEIRNKGETSQVNGALMEYEIVDSSEGSTLYQNLLLQKSILAKQLNSVLFNEPQKYIETSLELTNLRLEAREDQEFDTNMEALQPGITSILKDNTYYGFLEKNQEEVILKPESIGSLVFLFLSVLGVIWFPICAFLTANALEDEYEHSSLVKGQPTTFMKRMIHKVLVLYAFFALSFGLALVIGGLLTQFLGNPINDLGNSQAVQLIDFLVLKNWQVMLSYFVYLSVLFFFVFSLSIFLNVVVRNFYLTLIIEICFYAITILLPNLISYLPWYVGSYIIPTYLFNGNYLLENPQTQLNPVYGLVSLLISILILNSLTSLLTKRGLKGVRE